MSYFAGALAGSAQKKVVYHKSHDEAGNSKGSMRTIIACVNGAPLIGDTRVFAEARSRFAFAMSLLSAGTPMILFGEEVGAQKRFRYNDFMDNREDLSGERQQSGARMFRFYQDLIRFRLEHPALSSRNIEIVHVNDDNRVIAFRRWADGDELLVVASLNNAPFERGYFIQLGELDNSHWKEVFNSDSTVYGGRNVTDSGNGLQAQHNGLTVTIPSIGTIILQKC